MIIVADLNSEEIEIERREAAISRGDYVDLSELPDGLDKVCFACICLGNDGCDCVPQLRATV